MNDPQIDLFDELSDKDKAELMELINEPDEKDTVCHDKYLKDTERWRSS